VRFSVKMSGIVQFLVFGRFLGLDTGVVGDGSWLDLLPGERGKDLSTENTKSTEDFHAGRSLP